MKENEDKEKVRAKPGRKPVTIRRDRSLRLRVTDAQLEHITALATAQNKSKSDYLLSFVPGLPDAEIPALPKRKAKKE